MTKRYFVIASEREAIQVEILNRVQSIHSNKKYHQLDCFAHARNDETAKARSYQTLPPPQEDRFALLFFPHGQKSILLFCYAARPLEGEG